MEPSVAFVPCIKCCATGTMDVTNRLPPARELLKCDYCKGQRAVPLLTCRGCGRPALHYAGPVVSYCGRKECWERLVEEVEFKKQPEVKVGFSPFPLRVTGRSGGFSLERLRGGMTDMEVVAERAKKCGMGVAEFLKWMERR